MRIRGRPPGIQRNVKQLTQSLPVLTNWVATLFQPHILSIYKQLQTIN